MSEPSLKPVVEMTDGQSIANRRISRQLIGVKPVQKDREMIRHQNRRLLWERKLDVLYFIFFVIHLPVMLGTTPQHLWWLEGNASRESRQYRFL